MLKIEQTPAFVRDFKKMKKKHFDMNKLKTVVEHLSKQDTDILLQKYKDHALIENWQGFRGLHIEKDWLLIYKINKKAVSLVLTRTGSHDDLL